MTLYSLLLLVVVAYLSFFVAYLMVFSILGTRYVQKRSGERPALPGSFAILIPAYGEDAVLCSTVKKCLVHDYPKDRFHVVVAWDGLQPATIAHLKELPITSLHVKGTKGQALEQALSHIHDRYDYVLVLDADNVMAPGCLAKMNDSFQKGAQVIQVHRTTKNANNPIEVLDSVSEEINNHIFRKGHQRMGLSAALIGSGMGFSYSYFRSAMSVIEGIWEDREMDLRILRDKVKVEYLDDAIVYDEKVGKPGVFLRQRAKWIAGQLNYVRRTYRFCREAPSLELVNKLVQAVCPPRSLLLGLLCLLALLGFAFPSPYGWYLPFLLLLYCLAMVIAIPRDMRTRILARAVLRLPVLIMLMSWALVLSIVKRKAHYHTPHRYE